MATLNTQDFPTLVENMAAAAQGAAQQVLDFTIGSILRAVVEAVAGVALFLQSLVLQVLTLTRASTSQGPDLDSWMADYGVTRLPAVAATGTVTFSRFTPTLQAVVPIGAQVITTDGSETFAVTLDTTNAAYSASLGGYVLAANVASVSVPVAASVAGSGGNVVAGAISLIGTAIPGVDTVTNAAAFTNGLDAESDAALRLRFVAYMASLSKATKGAVGYALMSLQQGLEYTITENADYNGTTDMGFFYVVLDDGSGHPSASLLASGVGAIDAVRPIGSRFAVFAPVVTTANVALTITTATGYDHPTAVGLVGTALVNYINALPLGSSLPYTRLAQVAYDAAPGVVDVSAILLNGGSADLIATNQNVIKAGTVTVA